MDIGFNVDVADSWSLLGCCVKSADLACCVNMM